MGICKRPCTSFEPVNVPKILSMRTLFYLLSVALVIVASPTKHTLCGEERQTSSIQEFRVLDDTQTTLFDADDCAPLNWMPFKGKDKEVFIPLDEFLEQVKGAKYNHYKHGSVRSSRAFEDMRNHILIMYGDVGKKVTRSFFLEEHVDCIDIKDQPSARIPGLDVIETAPPPTPGPPTGKPGGPREGFRNITSPLKLGHVDSFGNSIACPKGTIPFSRITLETLTKFPTLKSFFSKTPDEIQPNQEAHQYAYAHQRVNNLGGTSYLSISNPVGDFSLSQQWYDAGSGSALQTVEGGWIVYPTKFGTTSPVLFVYFTPDNYASGCYNLDCVGFVQTNSNWAFGGPFAPISVVGGLQYEFTMQWKLASGNWWLYLQGDGAFEAVGYYPVRVYKGGLMASNAANVKYGGEVYRNSAGVNWPQMGSSVLPSGGFGRSAYQHTISYTDLSNNRVVPKLTDNVIGSKSCWSIDLTQPEPFSGWQPFFFYGGPGGSVCTA